VISHHEVNLSDFGSIIFATLLSNHLVLQSLILDVLHALLKVIAALAVDVVTLSDTIRRAI